jgi:hypothetical protein
MMAFIKYELCFCGTVKKLLTTHCLHRHFQKIIAFYLKNHYLSIKMGTPIFRCVKTVLITSDFLFVSVKQLSHFPNII